MWHTGSPGDHDGHDDDVRCPELGIEEAATEPAGTPAAGPPAGVEVPRHVSSDVVRVGKRLSYVLRHRPDSVGLTLDEAGWVDVDALLAALAAYGLLLTRAGLDRVVAGDDKGRFAYDGTGRRIRASQGHSVPVALGYAAEPPPAVLFHGTVERVLPAIEAEGLQPGRRHAVHLSPDVGTARRVGARRRGRAVVLRVDAAGLAATGAVFTRSANGVWLVDAVPPPFLTVLDD
ncbi:RNA 2'-phosphotransferase [Geodermatophilus maliterrae]|uniref:Probable RNA 2'-phosphotransferase n=1 Tax=Geodermatophilus maliterrae TaxID=3162531 RepID=A0ABV3XFL3_9ACTN